MKTKDDVNSVVGTILTEIEQLNEEIDLVPKIIAKQSSPEDFEFRPLHRARRFCRFVKEEER